MKTIIEYEKNSTAPIQKNSSSIFRNNQLNVASESVVLQRRHSLAVEYPQPINNALLLPIPQRLLSSRSSSSKRRSLIFSSPLLINNNNNNNNFNIQQQHNNKVVSAQKVGIDLKIEQAMELVKTHLMIAVREEMDLLRSKILEFETTIIQLEAENSILRENIPVDILEKLTLQQPSQLTINPTTTTTTISINNNNNSSANIMLINNNKNKTTNVNNNTIKSDWLKQK